MISFHLRRAALRTLACLAICVVATPLNAAEKKYSPGASDREIRIGQTFAYSGPVSSYATLARTEQAYFDRINSEGGVNGRKLKLISLDDAYAPPKTVEQTRKLVESDEVLLLFQSLGTPTVTAVQKYVNARKVPTLFIASGASRWGDVNASPWTMGWQPTYHIEMALFAKYIMKHHPDAKVGLVLLNNDAGKDFHEGIRSGFGDQYKKFVVGEATIEPTDPTVDSQIIALHATGANVIINTVPPKAAAQTIRKVADLGWKPVHFLSSISSSVATVLQPAGLEKSTGIISGQFLKDPSDAAWASDAGVTAYRQFIKQWNPAADPFDIFNVYGYTAAQTLVQVLRQCGDDLTRENVLRQASNLKKLELPLLLPGVRINTSATDHFPIESLQMMRFDGARWVRFGEVWGD